MLFNSWQFIFLFFPLTLAGFFLLPAHPLGWRKVWLIGASVFFYAYWRVEYIFLLAGSIAFNFAAAEFIARQANRRAAKAGCAFGVAGNLALLAYFKYANFFLQTLNSIADLHYGVLTVVLPLAISFFTFTQISYLVDVYRDPTLHHRLLDYILFVVFFPHLIAGPIVRHWEVIPQFADRVMRVRLSDAGVGVSLFLMGLCKKIFVADQLSPYVTEVYTAADKGVTLPWFESWFATLAFALQIYFDFSGYSDMAIGLARTFGIKFPMNFHSPYKAESINEFWTRWHITLTRFLREYVYFPLGGNRCGHVRHVLNIVTTMLVSGLWHGAGWTFVLWGGLHGAFLVVAHRWRKAVTQRWNLHQWWYRAACVGLTFLVTLVAWVFFRAPTLHGAVNLLTSMFGGHGWTMSERTTRPNRFPGVLFRHLGIRFVPPTYSFEGLDLVIRVVVVTLLIVFLMPNSQQLLHRYEPVLEKTRAQWFQLRLGWPVGFAAGLILFLVLHSFYSAQPSPFVYFNF